MLFEWYQGISCIVNSFSTVQNLHQHALFPKCFGRQWGINNLLWLKKLILFPKLLIVQERNDFVVAPLCLGLQTTYYWNKHSFITFWIVCVCLCCSLLLKACMFSFSFFQFHPNGMWWSSCTMFIRDAWRYYLVMIKKFAYIILDACVFLYVPFWFWLTFWLS